MSVHDISLASLVADTPDLPSMPAAALAVIQETDSSQATARSVSRHLAQDQALTTRVLRLANSAYYGMTRQVSDINEAVVVLGMRAVRNLAVVASSYPWLAKPCPGYDLGPEQLWMHAFGTAVGSYTVAKRSGMADPDTVFTAGLVHNVGMVVLSTLMDGSAGSVHITTENPETPFSDAEKRIFGYSHSEVGAYLGEQWNLPKSLISAIRYHHDPNSAEEYQEIVDCVHIGDSLSFALDLGVAEEGMLHRLSTEALRRMKIEPDAFESLVEDSRERFAEYAKMYQLDNAKEIAA